MSASPSPSPPLLSPVTPTASASWAGPSGCGPSVWVKTALPRSVAQIAATLASNSEEWKGRVAALHEIERIVVDSIEYERVAAGTSAAASFTVTLGALLSSLAPALSTQISDLRSEIVRQCAHTISALATQLGDRLSADRESVMSGPFHKCGAKLLPSLLTQAASSNSVIRGYAMQACTDVVAHVMSVVGSGGAGVLGHLLSEVKHTKNKAVKSVAMGLISDVVLTTWPRRLWGGAPPSPGDAATPRAGASNAISASSNTITHLLLEEHILIGLNSADTQTRAHAARAVWHYARFGSVARAAAFLKQLEPRMRKTVLEARNADDEGVQLDAESTATTSVTADPTSRKSQTTASRVSSVGSSAAASAEDDSSTLLRNGSDGSMTKALADARRKQTMPNATSAAGATAAAGGLASSAKRVSSATAPSALTSSAMSAGGASAGASASSSASSLGLKKMSLGAPSRVMMKKPPAAASTAALAPAATAAASGKTPATRVPTDPSAMVSPSSFSDDSPFDDLAHLRHVRSHTRALSSYQLDDLQGLLNDTELSAVGVGGASGLDVLGLDDAAHSAQHTPAQLSPVTTTARSIDLQSHETDSSTATPLAELPAATLALPPAAATVSTAPKLASSSSASTMSVPPKLKTVVAAPPAKASTGSTLISGRKTAPAGALAAATALLRATAAAASSAKPATATPDPPKRRSVPATAATSTTSASTTATAATAAASRASSRRATMTTSTSATSAASSRAATRPSSRSASKSRSVSGRVSPVGGPVTPRDGERSRQRSSSRPATATALTSPSSAPVRAKTPTRPKTPTTAQTHRPKTPTVTPSRLGTAARGGASAPGSASAITSPSSRPTPRTPRTPSGTGSSANSMPKLKLGGSAGGSGASSGRSAFGTSSASAASMSGLDPLLFSSSAVAALLSPSTPRSGGDATAATAASTGAPAVGSVPANSELAVLLRDHRLHLSDSAMHLQHLHSLLQSTVSSLSVGPQTTVLGDAGVLSPPSGMLPPSASCGPYVDSMIHLLSDSLAKTTTLLEGFMRLKRKDMAAQQATLHMQQQLVHKANESIDSTAAASNTRTNTSHAIDAAGDVPPVTPSAMPVVAVTSTSLLPVPDVAASTSSLPLSLIAAATSQSSGDVPATTPTPSLLSRPQLSVVAPSSPAIEDDVSVGVGVTPSDAAALSSAASALLLSSPPASLDSLPLSPPRSSTSALTPTVLSPIHTHTLTHDATLTQQAAATAL